MTANQYMRDSYKMYLEGYDHEIDDLPPVTWENWVAAYGAENIAQGIRNGDIAVTYDFDGPFSYVERAEDAGYDPSDPKAIGMDMRGEL